MRRMVSLMIAAALILAANARLLDAQSMAKMDGPMVKLDNLKSQTYGYWKEEKKPAAPAVYQFLIPETLKSTREESAVLSITPVTGDEKTILAGLNEKMVKPDAVKLSKVKTGVGELTQLYYFGTTKEGVGSAEKTKERQRILAFVVPSKEKKYLITLIGPSRAIGGSQGNFINWVKNFK